MGNTQAQRQAEQVTEESDLKEAALEVPFLAEFECQIGESELLRSAKCRTRSHDMVIRFYTKPRLANPRHQRQLELELEAYRMRYAEMEKQWSFRNQPGLIPLCPISNMGQTYKVQQSHDALTKGAKGSKGSKGSKGKGSEDSKSGKHDLAGDGQRDDTSPDGASSHAPTGSSSSSFDDATGSASDACPAIQCFTPKGYFLTRPYFGNTLFDVLNVAPGSQDTVEKKWVAYQLLRAIDQAHSTKLGDGTPVVHGDIKTENIMLGPGYWVLLTDFHPFKPDKLALDDDSDWELFFSDKRERCYVAPERFYESKNSGKEYTLSPLADIFSVGCVIAEIFMDGQALFNREQLLAYKEDKYDPTQMIAEKISDKYVLELVEHCIKLDPSARWTAIEYLTFYKNKMFPSCFEQLYDVFQTYLAITDADSDRGIRYVSDHFCDILSSIDKKKDNPNIDIALEAKSTRFGLSNANGKGNEHKRDGNDETDDHDAHGVTPAKRERDRSQHNDLESDLRLKDNRVQSLTDKDKGMAKKEDRFEGGLIILTNLLCDTIAHCRSDTSKFVAMELLRGFGEHLPDTFRLCRLVPCIGAVVDNNQKTPILLVKAVMVITDILSRVVDVPTKYCGDFPDYTFDIMLELVNNRTEKIRFEIARHLGTLALSAKQFIENRDEDHGRDMATVDLEQLRKKVVTIFEALFQDDCLQVQRALLKDGIHLCEFLGSSKTQSHLFPFLLTFLNHKEWELRVALLDIIVGVSFYIGHKALHTILLPCLEECLNDTRLVVVERCLKALTSLAELKFFDSKWLLSIIRRIAPFVCHYNNGVKNECIKLLLTAALVLGESRAHCRMMLTLLEPFLMRQIACLDRESVTNALKPQLNEKAFKLLIQDCKCKSRLSFTHAVSKATNKKTHEARGRRPGDRRVKIRKFSYPPCLEEDETKLGSDRENRN